MSKLSNSRLTSNARNLRKNMTKEERHLWYDFLRELPVNVHRQKVIGRYIVDFYIAEIKLVIELDGSQHYEESAACKDRERDTYLQSLGISVVRYSNGDVNQNFSAVCQDIYNRLELGGDPTSVSCADSSSPRRSQPHLSQLR